jgi:UDP-glucose:(heptosyl)LPS alpha-1,3-glucosyltransferase
MKVAIVIERHDIALGGAERSISELSGALERMGVEVHLLVAKGQGQAKNLHVLCDGEKGRTSFGEFVGAVREHVSRNKYDIVHSTLPMAFADIYQPRGGSYAETIIRSAASYENGIIAWAKLGTSWLNLRRQEMLRAEEGLSRGKKDGPVIAALSQYVVEQFKAHYGTPAERIELIPNGVRQEPRPDAETADRLRGQILVQLKIQEATNPAIFLFAANNFRLKGLGPLIRGLAISSRLRNSRPPVLVVAGSDSTTGYKFMATRLGVGRSVLFAGKARNVQGLLAASDAAVLPSFYDPCSRFILEGLAAGKPVITTSFNGASERYEHGRHGFVVEKPEDAPELAKAICFYCEEENVRKASLAIERDGLAEGLSVDKHAAQLVKLYERLIARRGN